MNFLSNVQTAEWIFNSGYQSLAVLSLSWGIFRLVRSKSAPLKSAIALATMAVLFFIPIMNVSIPLLQTKTIGPTLSVKIGSSFTKNAAPLPHSFWENAPASFDRSGTLPAENRERAVGHLRLTPLWIQVINLFGLLWCMGSLFCLLRFFYGVLSLHKLKKNLVKLESASIEHIVRETNCVFSRTKNILIYTTPDILTPVALGIFKPFILLPSSSLTSMRPSQMKGILIHELSHIYHHDHLIGVLQRLMTMLNWWNPLAHRLSAALSRAREEISDNCVLLRNPSKEYAECLVDLAESRSFLKRLPVATAMASSHIPLKERVTLILSKERNMDIRLKKSSLWALVLTAGLCLIIISGTRATFASQTSEEQPQASPEKSVVQQDIQPQQQKQKEEDPVRAIKDIKPPKLIKKVEPVYPELARKSSVQGAVILEVTADIFGKVKKTKILRSIPLLDQAAIDAVEQWIYEPLIVDGEPRPVIFTVTCRFKLDKEVDKKDAESSGIVSGITGGVQGGVTGGVAGGVVGGVQGGVEGGVGGQVVVFGDFEKPNLLKKIDPVYPLDARKAGIKGEVILQVTIDEKGNVIQAQTIESIPALDRAAIEAVKQWVYEPYIIDGKARSVVFQVTVIFFLK